MNPTSAILKVSNLLKLNADGPTILKEAYLGKPYIDFTKSSTAKDISQYFSKKENADTMVALAYAAFAINSSSKALNSPINFQTILQIFLDSFSSSFPSLLESELKRNRFNLYAQGTRIVKLEENYNKALNLNVFPKAVAIQILTSKTHSIDASLNAQLGYAFRSVPSALREGNTKISSLKNMPIYQWTFFKVINGVSISILRINKNMLALRLEFTIPFILPIGSLSIHTVNTKIGECIQNLSIGVH